MATETAASSQQKMLTVIAMDMQEIIDVGLKEQQAATLAAQKEKMAAREEQRAAAQEQFSPMAAREEQRAAAQEQFLSEMLHNFQEMLLQGFSTQKEDLKAEWVEEQAQFLQKQTQQLAQFRTQVAAERQVELKVRLRKCFVWEAIKAELQEERNTDEAQLEADCAKCRDEEEAELRARFDAAEQEPGVAKLAVQLAVQDVSEPELNCVEQKAGQHAEVGQEVKEELQRISVKASVAVVMVSADTAAASAATSRQLVGAATPAAAPGKITDSKRVADVAPWITQLKERFKALDMERDARWAAQLKQYPTGLDAKGAAQ